MASNSQSRSTTVIGPGLGVQVRTVDRLAAAERNGATVAEDESFDFVIVGSGGGGLVAALVAAEAGLRPVVLEKQAVVGGSTAMSGGVVWLPNNPLMRADGVDDSVEAGMAYFDSVVSEAGPYSSIPRREAFLRGGSQMVTFLQKLGVEFVRCPGYSDYYDTREGGNVAGRSIEGVPWDAHQLGDWQDKINPGMARAIGLVVKTNEVRDLPVFTRSARSFAVATRVLLRTWKGRARGQDLLVDSASGLVTGVCAVRDGAPVTVRAERGVLLSAGGFERNAQMRRTYSGAQPSDAEWTSANPGNTGEVLAAAIALGAKTDLLDEAWWPTPRPEIAESTLNVARQLPRTILVNKAGSRFCNESNSYVEVGKATVMGRTYPGAGASIANTLIFGYLPAQHLTGGVSPDAGDTDISADRR